MTLLETQRRMAAAVMSQLTARDGMRRRTASGGSMVEEAASFIKPNKRLSSFERLEIYNRQYWFRVQSAFMEDFPALRAILGERRFEAMTRAYLEANPSRSFTLRNLGSSLEAWLRLHPEWAGARQAMALDVARLEWAYIEAFDNGEERALTLADLARLDGDSLLSLQPHVRLLHLFFPADNYIVEVHRRQAATEAVSNAVTKAPKHPDAPRVRGIHAQETFLAVHRFDYSVYYKRLEPEAYRLLEGLAAGATLGAALEHAFANRRTSAAGQAEAVRQWFAAWAELGWFCGHRKHASTQARRKAR